MGIFSARSASDNPNGYKQPKLNTAKAAKVARRGGSAVSATSSKGQPRRGGTARGGSR